MRHMKYVPVFCMDTYRLRSPIDAHCEGRRAHAETAATLDRIEMQSLGYAWGTLGVAVGQSHPHKTCRRF